MRTILPFLASVLAAAAQHHLIHRQSPSNAIPPSQDPWYAAPADTDLASYQPGYVFKIRTVPGANLTASANVSSAYNILYRTTNSQYQASWAVTTLLLPSGWDDSCQDQLLAYGVAYDSADLDASPSATLFDDNGVLQSSDISTSLGRGWAVVAADYEGPSASFTAGVTAGLSTIDSMRAVFTQSDLFGMHEVATTYALWGYSGGALASEWALELQPNYAPELQVDGAALGGLTPNITSVLLTIINGTVYAGIAPAGILGLSSQYPELSAYVQSLLKRSGPYNATVFNDAARETLYQAIATFVGQDIDLYFTNGLLAALQAPVVEYAVGRDGIMGTHGTPRPPLFIYKAVADDVSPVADTDKLVSELCDNGAVIKYERNLIGNHATELNNGRDRALSFLDAIFAGTYAAAGCEVSNVTVSQ